MKETRKGPQWTTNKYLEVSRIITVAYIQLLYTLNGHKSHMKQYQSVEDPTSQAMIQTSEQPEVPLWKLTISHLWTYMAPACRKLKRSGDLSQFTTFLPTARQKEQKLCFLQNRDSKCLHGSGSKNYSEFLQKHPFGLIRYSSLLWFY